MGKKWLYFNGSQASDGKISVGGYNLDLLSSSEVSVNGNLLQRETDYSLDSDIVAFNKPINERDVVTVLVSE